MSHNMGLHMLKTDPPCRSVIRRDKTVVRQASKDGQASKVRVISLQGSVNFVAAEQVTLHLADLDKDVALVLDLRSVTAIYEAGRMLLTAAIEILLSNGQEVSVIDHHHLLPKDRMKGANRVANLKQVVPDHVAHDNQVQEM
jgi:MFS superfamily sulfate permease-like transporter